MLSHSWAGLTNKTKQKKTKKQETKTQLGEYSNYYEAISSFIHKHHTVTKVTKKLQAQGLYDSLCWVQSNIYWAMSY